MQIHLLSCGSLCPLVTQGLLYGKGSLRERAHIPCQCLLIELSDRLVLVDTGIGCHDIQSPWFRLGAITQLGLLPKRELEQTALHQVQSLGYQAKDVREIIVTHLDPDHAGGLRDFPWARVHVHESEFQSAVQDFPSFLRYKTQQWAHGCDWVRYQDWGEQWEGFRCVKGLKGLKEQILLVPLEGHSPGSMGIAVKVPNQAWLFHVGDAIFQMNELESGWNPSGLKLFARHTAYSNEMRVENVERLKKLHRSGLARILCSHDPRQD